MPNYLNKVITLGSVVLFLTSCGTPRTSYPVASADELARETAIQQKIAANQRNGSTPSTQSYEDRLTTVANQLVYAATLICDAITQGKNCDSHFALQKSDKLNAYADGDTIVITTRMMDFTQNDEELALILAHEYAHNLLEHPQNQRNSAMVGSLIGSAIDIIASTQGVSTGSLFSKGGQHIATMRYSKEFESEADYVGFYIMANADFHIGNVAELWRRMSIENNSSIYASSTHPTNPERYVSLKKTVAEIRYKKRKKLPLVPNMRPLKE